MIGRSILPGLLAAVLFPFGGSAYHKTERGNARYLDGLYADALREYTEAQVALPEAPELYYDIGNVLYRQNDLDGSAEAFARALDRASPELAGAAAFNLGNARFRQGDYEAAVEAYERALVADPGDMDAKRNLELALWALERQRQQPQAEEEPGQDPEEAEQPQPQEEEERPEEPEPPTSPEVQTPESEEPEGQMTPEQAERMLDGLQEQERENLRSQALQQPRASRQTTGEDW